MKKRKQPKSRVIQLHHPDYNRPDYTVPMFRSEHEIRTKENRMLNWKEISESFIEDRDEWIKKLDLLIATGNIKVISKEEMLRRREKKK